MAADIIVMQGARLSRAMVLTYFVRIIQNSGAEVLADNQKTDIPYVPLA